MSENHLIQENDEYERLIEAQEKENERLIEEGNFVEPRKDQQVGPAAYVVLERLYDQLDHLDERRSRLIRQIHGERRLLQKMLGLPFDAP